jgi:hypothetical protein
MAITVNLDALIRREDFEVVEDKKVSQLNNTMQIRDLEKDSFFFSVLRKPDFQRETSEWTPKKIFGFVSSFINGDLIPALILWRSGSLNFVIDGAHRLSALIAWVHDDYGDGNISQLFFQGRITEDQIKAAESTRLLINKMLGSYEEYKFAVSSGGKGDPKIFSRAQLLASLGIQLQWVNGDSTKAEDSFFKINQQATPINKTEIILLKSRTKPNALAARAIIRSGAGHKYWSNFEVRIKDDIEKIAAEINDILFKPPLKTPIKTLDLPIAGQAYSVKSLPLVFDLINISNEHIKDESTKVDIDGLSTIKFLKNTRSVVYKISGSHPSSLGFHPAIYFYSAMGRYQPYSFLAIVDFVKKMDSKNSFSNFIRVRGYFEKFLLKHRDIQNQIAVKYSSGRKGAHFLSELYLLLVSEITKSDKENEIIKSVNNHVDFKFLKFLHNEADIRENQGVDFSTDTKSSVFLQEALTNVITCKLCGGIIHSNSISFDHITRKQDGGRGDIDNAQITHPYCNTTFKN